MKTPSFRPATANDVTLIRELAERIWRLSYVEMISPEQIDYMLNWMYSADKIAAELSEGVCWEILELEGQPVGYLSLSFDGAEAELHKLYLLPEYQGRGLGQTMLTRALEIASSMAVTTLALRVNKQNHRALKAYQRAGFHHSHDAVADIGGGFVMDDYILRRELP